VDRLGRKLLLLVSMIGMILTLVALGVFFYIRDSDPETAETLGWLPLTSLCIYIVAFAIGYGPIPWILMSEIYSKDFNAIASKTLAFVSLMSETKLNCIFSGPITGAFSWTLAFGVTSAFRPIGNSIGMGPTFWIFAGISVLGAFFTFLVIPETKNKSIADIQRELAGEKSTK